MYKKLNVINIRNDREFLYINIYIQLYINYIYFYIYSCISNAIE